MSDVTMKVARLAVRLEDTLNTMKRLYGNGWDKAAEPFRDIIRGAMKEHNVGAIKAALPIAIDMNKKGHSPILFLAVAADMASQEGGDG